MASVLDSASLQAQLADLWSPDFGLVIGLISYDAAGELDAASVMGESFTQAYQEELGDVLRGVAAPSSSPGNRIEVFLGDDAGPRAYRVSEFRGCPPSVAHPDRLQQDLARAGRSLGLRAPLRAVVAAFVGTNGRAEEVRIVQSSGDDEADEIIVGEIEAADFTPARIEGIELGMSMQVPVTLYPPPPG